MVQCGRNSTCKSTQSTRSTRWLTLQRLTLLHSTFFQQLQWVVICSPPRLLKACSCIINSGILENQPQQQPVFEVVSLQVSCHLWCLLASSVCVMVFICYHHILLLQLTLGSRWGVFACLCLCFRGGTGGCLCKMVILNGNNFSQILWQSDERFSCKVTW